ncbi:MAG: ABC transporter permease, partial [Cryobacterium sp.]|nr:ABC transporter permease [Cryobacterium sp.]
MNDTWIVAEKELLDLRRDRLSAILITFLGVATLISVAVASADFRNQLDAYNAYVANLAQSGSTVTAAAPQLFPLKLLRGGIEYLEILGALFAIVLGYGTIAKEKYRGTLALFLSRPVSRFSFAGGKVLGLAIMWLGVVTALTTLSLLAVVTIGHAPVHGIDVARLLIAGGFAWLYLVFWTALAVGLTSLYYRLRTGHKVALVILLTIVRL